MSGLRPALNLAAPPGTSLRSRPVAQTIASARRLVPALGGAQVVDVTALDHLSLPVCVSVRAGASALRVHAGKGLSPADALAGALMEAVEYAVCLQAGPAVGDERLPWSRLVATWPAGLQLADFAPRLGEAIRWRAHTLALRCEQLASRRSVWLPAELVLLPPVEHGPQLFGSSTNGLASGNTLQEATLHALLEVLERDTVALHIARDTSRLLTSGSLPAPFAQLAPAWRRRGVRLHVRWLPNDAGLPCFEAGLHEPGAALAPLVLSRGWGLHFDRHVALSRAICEAAQARLATIVAHRPDVPGSAELALRLGPLPGDEVVAQRLRRLCDTRRRVAFDAVPHEGQPGVGEALRALLSRLPAAGLGPAFRRRLHLEGRPAALRGLHVVKVVVARAETPVGEHPRMGPRLLARLQGG